MENPNKSYLGHWMILLFVALIALMIVVKTFWLAWTSVWDYLLEQPMTTIIMPTIVQNKEIPYVIPPKVVERVKTQVKEVKPLETPKIQTWESHCTAKVRLDLVNHAYKISGWDMKFLWTIASESMFDVNSNGDAGKSFWHCQFHKW